MRAAETTYLYLAYAYLLSSLPFSTVLPSLSKRTHDADGPAAPFITTASTGNMFAPIQCLHNGMNTTMIRIYHDIMRAVPVRTRMLHIYTADRSTI
jgi:hypothetical protein